MEFHTIKPSVGAKAGYQLNRYEEEYFSDVVIEQFNATFENYFDQYKNCILHENHLKLLTEIISNRKADKQLKNLHSFFHNCYVGEATLYYVAD